LFVEVWTAIVFVFPPVMLATDVTADGVCQAGSCPEVNVRTWPLVPAAKNVVVLAAV
jgi:hypothetical protein